MIYNNIKFDDSTPAELFVEMFWVFALISGFFIILGIGIIWSSRVELYEKILSEGVKGRELEIDFDSASKGRAGRPQYSSSYYNIQFKFKDNSGREYMDYASMSVIKYQELAASFDHVHRDPGDDVRLLYLPDDPHKNWLYPYEEADYPQYYGGWGLIILSIGFVIVGAIARYILKSRNM
ncbi:MAG TPA: DUF3592 domain-containing protein [Thermodesulfobacteriota bacterium]|nr:DUF3592 domain-containing protein [Thermodesulfobacteriota bacterium]